jgi:hypothetical protein
MDAPSARTDLEILLLLDAVTPGTFLRATRLRRARTLEKLGLVKITAAGSNNERERWLVVTTPVGQLSLDAAGWGTK